MSLNQRRVSVTFDENVITSNYLVDNEIEEQNIITTEDIGIQTDSNWLEVLKSEILTNFKTEQNDAYSNRKKSRSGTIISHATKRSTLRSRKSKDLTLDERSELGSAKSNRSSSSIPTYPEMIVNDEYGLAYLDSSEEDDDPINLTKLTSQTPQQDNGNTSVIPNNLRKALDQGMLVDAGLPAAFRPSKELSDIPGKGPGDILRQGMLTADEIIQRAISIDKTTIINCDFCGKSLKQLPSVTNQTSEPIDPSNMFCCQQYRDLLDYALQQKEQMDIAAKKSQRKKLIDVSPGKSFKSDVEIAEAKAKSERKIREKLIERQQAALLAAQMARQQKIEQAKRATTDIQPTLPIRQLKVVNYQLSNDKYLKDGWTIPPQFICLEEIQEENKLNQEVLSVDFTAASFEQIFNHGYLSDICLEQGYLKELYPDTGQPFLILLASGNGNIYYPSGNLAITFIRDDSDNAVTAIVRDDKTADDNKCNLLAVVSTKGAGNFFFADRNPRVVFNGVSGTEYNFDSSRKRQWFWSGKPHVHAPPFQPIFFSLNRNIGVRISSQNQVILNFLGTTRHIHINVGCKSQMPQDIQQKLLNMNKTQLEKLMEPLMILRQRIRQTVRQSNIALTNPLASDIMTNNSAGKSKPNKLKPLKFNATLKSDQSTSTSVKTTS